MSLIICVLNQSSKQLIAMNHFESALGQGRSMGSQLHGQSPSTACQHGQRTPCACNMGDLAFTKMDEIYAPRDAHSPTVAEIFAGEDNTTQH